MITIAAATVPQGVSSAASNIVVRFVDPASEPGWDTSLGRLQGFSLFHGSAWAKVLNDSYGFRARHVVAESHGVPCGLFPLMEVDNWPKHRRGIALPFTDEAPLLAVNPTVRECLANAVVDEGRRRRWQYLEARGCVQAFAGARPSISFYGHRLPLHQDETQLFTQCSSAARRAVRKALKSGLTITIANGLDAMYDFYRLHLRTRQKHGIPPQSFTFFKHLHRRFLECGHGFVTTASLAGNPVAAAVFLAAGVSASYKFGASDERFQHLRGNNLVMWESIRWLARNGFAELDFGRTSLSNQGLRHFKLGWGASESRIDYCKYAFETNRFVTHVDPASSVQSRIFRLLPNPFCRWIGALIYSRLA